MMEFNSPSFRFVARLAGMSLIVLVPFWSYKFPIVKRDGTYNLLLEQVDHAFIGGSRMRAALSPEHFLDSVRLEGALTNIAINGGTTPYGSCLLRWARNKIARTGPSQRLFILEWHASLLESKPRNIHSEGGRESEEVMHNLWFQIMDPQVEYMLRPVVGGEAWYARRGASISGLHPSGWRERTRKKSPIETEKIARLKERSMENQRSPHREDAFLQLVSELSERGDVLLIHLPESDSLRSEFDQLQDETLSAALKLDRVRFWDYSSWADLEDFADVNHLAGDAAIRLTREIAHRWSEEGPAP